MMIIVKQKSLIFFGIKILFLLLVLLTAACKGKQGKPASPPRGIMTVDLPNAIDSSREYKLSDIAEDIEYIKPEARAGSFLNRILKVRFSSDYLFIQNGCGVLQFLRDGRFVRQIGAFGRGPGEYLCVGSFAIDESSQRIYLYAIQQQKLIVYSFNGKYLRSYPLKSEGESLELLAPGRLLVSNIANPDAKTRLLSIIDTAGVTLKSFPLTIKEAVANPNIIRYNSLFTTSSNENRFWPFLSDSVYTIEKNGAVKVAYNLSYGSYKPSYQESFVSDLGSSTGKMKSKIEVVPYAETSSLLFFTYMTTSIIHRTVFDKRTGEVFSLAERDGKSGLINDIDGGFLFIPKFSRDGFLVGWYDADKFIASHSEEFLASSKALYPEKKAALIKLLKEMKEDDNPVIVMVRLKKSESI